jgi:hypothetical protein
MVQGVGMETDAHPFAWLRLTSLFRRAAALAGALASISAICAEVPAAEAAREFAALLAAPDWRETFLESGAPDWPARWMLDGERAKVENTAGGLSFAAGPERGVDADHAVLWTQASFAGDLRLSFDYTRTDQARRDVNILYMHAQGTGEGPHAADLAEWSGLRRVPAMRVYFQNLKAWHLSLAAFENNGPESVSDYLRVRRYPVTPERSFSQTEVPPTYRDSGLFLTGVTYRLTVIKTATRLFLHARHAGGERLYAWDVSAFREEEKGRVGLRHMHGRSATYQNFTISERRPQD